MQKNLPDKKYFIGKTIPGKEDYKITDYIEPGGNAHVFKAYSEATSHTCACKVIPKKNLKGKWKEEVIKANIIGHHAVVTFFHVDTWLDEVNNIDCVVLLSTYIKGWNLETYIKTHKEVISVRFIQEFLKEMLTLIHEMEKNKVTHGDLSSRNILVEDRSDLLGGLKYAFRVTDFGVTYTMSNPRFKDDYEQIAFVIRELLMTINYQELSAHDKYVYNILNDHFLAHLVEKDTTRDPLARQTRKLYEKLEKIDDEFNKYQIERAQVKLLTPFDYLSCEQIGESYSLFNALYSSLFLGLQEIKSRNNLVLTGPRGCGKSMVFKSLSLRYRICINNDIPDEVDFIGIYYRCYDLYAAFPRYKKPVSEANYDIPIHYLTATLICEMLESVELWAVRHYKNEFIEKEEKISKSVLEVLNFKLKEGPGTNSFQAIISYLQKQRKLSVDKQHLIHVSSEPLSLYFGSDILIKVCEILLNGFTFLLNKPFYFFIDDYSIPKISAALQSNINRLVMQRTSCAFFKLSTDSPVSYLREDLDGKAYVEGREFELLNLATVYLSADSSNEMQFIEDIFKRRFEAVETYPVANLDELIGSCKVNSNAIAIDLREGKKTEIWGKQILCELCSGDIFYIISLVGRMVSDMGETKGLIESTSTPKISMNIQAKAIRSEAGIFLDSLSRLKNGKHLVAVVTAFGNVAFSYLKYKNSKNEEEHPPHQASRIEPYEALELGSEAQEIYNELLKYSLFIEDPRGKSMRGRVVPRLYLRRSLLPHFNLTFSKRDSIGLDNVAIKKLLLEPAEFEKNIQLKRELMDDRQEELNFKEDKNNEN